MHVSKLLAAVAVASAFTPAAAHAELIYALLNNSPATGQQLVTFDSDVRSVTSTITLQTTAAANSLASIDFRPATGELYGYAAAQRQIYVINRATGALTPIGPSGQGPANAGVIDFNPVADLIRLVGGSTGGENLRVNPVTGAIVGTDTPVAYAAGDANAGKTPNVTSLAYTRAAAGVTTLYGIDRDTDALVTQNPPNAGTLQTVGPVGFDVGAGTFGSFTGFDVSGATGTAFLTNSMATNPFGPTAVDSRLYTVNLTTGAATSLGLIAGVPGTRSVADIAVAPEPATAGLLGAVAVGLLAKRRNRTR